LTLPSAVKAVSSLESEGLMAEMNRQLEADQSLRQAYAAAHRDYLERRDQLERVAQIAAVSAGGMPNRVKCLHALVAHALAVGQGINPIGDWALMAAEPRWRLDRCVC
jgi:hypothetical protein